MSTATGSSTWDRLGRSSGRRCLARPLLHPIAFAEPFGPSVVEAMACGTPVITYPRGLMPEGVTEGVTGLLVDGVESGAPFPAPPRRTGPSSAAWRNTDSPRSGWSRTTVRSMPSLWGPGSSELFTRSSANPLLTPSRWPHPIHAVMNAGATVVGDETVLCRIEDRRGSSHPTVARSHDAYSDWVVDELPLLAPDPGWPEQAWGLHG